MLRRTPVRTVLLTAVVVLLGLAGAAVTTPSGAAPAGSGDRSRHLYTAKAGFEVDHDRRVNVDPDAAYAYGVDLDEVRTALSSASTSSATTFALPDPDGHLQTFTVVADSVLAPRLAAAHPEISTWAGRSVEDPRVTVRIDVTPLGLHASVRSLTGSGTWYVDPAYVTRGASTTLSYYAADLAPDAADHTFVERDAESAEAVTGVPAKRAGGLVERRTFRLALLNDPSYATYFGTGNVLAQKTTLVNRVDQIYNDDLGVRLVLVDGTDSLNLDTKAKATGSNGPCGSSPCFASGSLDACSENTLADNQDAIDAILGRQAYDVGHVVLGTDGGGLAALGVVGGSAKAEGCTGLSTPQGDFFYVDYVAHELGHQFGADHTFAGSHGSCSGNGNASTAVEPGSGSSVMAYAGICGTDDLQPHSDPYFSHKSIAQIADYLDTTDAGTSATTANHAPTVTAPADLTIPKQTPFTLTANGADADGDALTYLWEESDASSNHALLSSSKSSGPLFRVFGTAAEVTDSGALESPSPGENTATGDASRTFPDLAQVVAGDTNADGTCPSGDVDCFSEFLPTVSRALHFVVTARDGYSAGGGTARDSVVLQVDDTTGPFLVTSQAEGETVTDGTEGIVTWKVNGTDALAPQVRILLSTDGGVTFPTTLADSTANDGSATVVWPAGDTSQARVMVQAVDNYFFAVNDGSFTITSLPSPPDTAITSGPPADGFSLTGTATVGIASTSDTATFDCRLDDAARTCEAPSVALSRISTGTHEFSVAATDANGTDPSPAVLRWSRPYGARTLAAHGSWTSVRSSSAYLGRSWQTRHRGVTLTTKTTVRRATRVALVVQTGSGFGRLRVSIGGQDVGTVRTASASGRHQVLRVLPAFAARSGTLRITTLQGRPVRVEGVGVLAAP